jgi:hypothetical protein
LLHVIKGGSLGTSSGGLNQYFAQERLVRGRRIADIFALLDSPA